MKYRFEWSPGGVVNLQVIDDQGKSIREVPDAVTIKEACLLLKKSRRHLYRYITKGWIEPVAKFSGEFFLDRNELERIVAPHPRAPTIPPSFSPLFPEYDIKTLNIERDSDLILGRILEDGNRREISWANQQYSLKKRQAFIESRGHRSLSPRALRFWSLILETSAKPDTQSWRSLGRELGGAA